jgi:hypothetical protein
LPRSQVRAILPVSSEVRNIELFDTREIVGTEHLNAGSLCAFFQLVERRESDQDDAHVRVRERIANGRLDHGLAIAGEELQRAL